MRLNPFLIRSQLRTLFEQGFEQGEDYASQSLLNQVSA